MGRAGRAGGQPSNQFAPGRLNLKLANWNEVLLNSDFPLFEKNDIRGADLSGLCISKNGDQVFLRHVDLSYSECHLLQLHSANLYGAQLQGVKGVQIDCNRSILHGATFLGAFIPNSNFVNCDLGYCDFRNCVLSYIDFNEANCHGTDFSSSLLLKTSFDHSASGGKKKYPDLSEVKWNSKTRFQGSRIQ